ncbi:MAG: AAA family ATPase [Planctomycetes bacterium]|nr:AAA family ATPase [Planctomycetota bacterium]
MSDSSPHDPRHVSQAPTLAPAKGARPRDFDVRDLYEGPAGRPGLPGAPASAGIPLAEKLRQAYFWIVNHAIITPYYDIEFNDPAAGPPRAFRFGGAGTEVRLPTDASFSSFVLLPILTFAVRKRALFIGGPGRGKTASAILMGILAGYSPEEVRRGIQHGQPQMTLADLLGNPLPRDLVEAKDMESIKIAWRRWIGMRVKIVDEYNRIPTRTQSALLTLLADGYAEILDQTITSPDSAWFLTANDDLGGGTYQVIEALKDRIDVVIKALNFNPRFLQELLDRVERELKPEELVPHEIVFSEHELDAIHQEILHVPIPPKVRRSLEFFAAQFDFCDLAAREVEYKTKDTIRIAGKTLSATCANDCGRDKVKVLCSQTENGLSVRALLTLLHYVKALAWFRGRAEVSIEDVRQLVPWVLHEKLVQNPTTPYLDVAGNAIYRIDRIAWIRRAFDLSCEEYARLGLEADDPVVPIENAFERGLDGVPEGEVRKRMNAIETHLEKLAKATKLYAHVQNDVLKLKYFHQRYSNYLRWLLSCKA